MSVGHILITGEAGHGKDTLGRHLIERYGYARTAFADALRGEIIDAWRGSPEPVTLEFMDRRDIKNVPQPRFALIHCSDQNYVRVALEAFALEDAAYFDEMARATVRAIDMGLEPRHMAIEGIDWEAARERGHFSLDDRMRLPRSYRRIAQVWGTEYRRRSVHGHEFYWIDIVRGTLRASRGPIAITDGRDPQEVNWAKASGMQRIHVFKPDHGETKVTHSSERIPPPCEETIVLINDQDVPALLDKLDLALSAAVARRAACRPSAIHG